jgi:hypothetical protein
MLPKSEKETKAMAQKDPKIEALETVYVALKSLNQAERQEIVASVFALLGIGAPPTLGGSTPAVTTGGQAPLVTPTTLRPKGLTEIMQERHPGTNPQRIAVFAYYRERHENTARFSRDDLKGYFGKSHLTPPKNYDRDFNKALKRGWLHEDGAESYITTRGIEAVESGFEGERVYDRHAKGATRTKASKSRRRKTTSKTK